MFPAFCQLVLKKTKPQTNANSQNLSVNPTNGTGKSNGSLRATPLNTFKNNNVTLNNDRNGQDKQYCNLLNNEKASGEAKGDDVDLEMGIEDDDGLEKCSGKSWPSIYIDLMDWKWFSVSEQPLPYKEFVLRH